MCYPSILKLSTENDYLNHFVNSYCKKQIFTFDGIRVKFKQSDFYHAFFERSQRWLKNKNLFSISRAQRMDWIIFALQEKNADLYQGWDKKTKKYLQNRRVTLVYRDYVVVIEILQKKISIANFITAFIADQKTLGKIRSNPRFTI